MKHDLPQVLTVVAITCRQCSGAEFYRSDPDGTCACHICENGYEKLMVPAVQFQMAVQVLFDDPEELHATIVRLAEAIHVRLPILTHLTANLPVHLLPIKPRILLASKEAAKQIPTNT